MDEFIRVMKSLSDENRVKIIKMLLLRSLCPCEIRAALALPEDVLSVHLKELENAGLIFSRKKGRWTDYYPSDGSRSPYAALMLASLRHWLTEDPEITELFAALPFIHRDNICSNEETRESENY